MTPATASTLSSRRTLSPALAYGLVSGVIGLALFASATPSPLYTTYRELWGFSPVVLTLVYATYAIGVLATLILAGRISDEVGRRPVLLVALTTLMGATVLFMVHKPLTERLPRNNESLTDVAGDDHASADIRQRPQRLLQKLGRAGIDLDDVLDHLTAGRDSIAQRQ